jgi:hypothetical protein
MENSEEIKLIRLVSNEEIMSYTTVYEDTVVINKPMVLVPTETGVGLMQMMPYTNIGEVATTIKKDKIVFITTPVATLIKKYESVVNKTPEIIVPDSKIVMN